MQIISAYLLAAATGSGNQSIYRITDVNGVFLPNVLQDGLTQESMNESTFDSNLLKVTRNSSPNTHDSDMSDLDEFYLTEYMLFQAQYYAKHLYYDENENCWAKDTNRIGQSNGTFYIPIKRVSGFNHFKFTGKTLVDEGIVDGDNFNYVVMGVAAVVNGVIQTRRSNLNTSVVDWTEFDVDISDLPYVDYVTIMGDIGIPGYRNFYLTT